VIFNEQPRGRYFRATGLRDSTVLKCVSLPLRLEELPPILRQEVEIMRDMLPKHSKLEDVFIKSVLDDKAFSRLKYRQDEKDRELASMCQQDPEAEDQDYDQESSEKVAQTGFSEDEGLADDYVQFVDEGKNYSNNSDGLWQPGDPISDSDSDSDSSSKGGIYTHIPVNGNRDTTALQHLVKEQGNNRNDSDDPRQLGDLVSDSDSGSDSSKEDDIYTDIAVNDNSSLAELQQLFEEANDEVSFTSRCFQKFIDDSVSDNITPENLTAHHKSIEKEERGPSYTVTANL
jgi:hypothetical protein